MAITNGTRLGSHEITGLLGKGWMGVTRMRRASYIGIWSLPTWSSDPIAGWRHSLPD